MRTNKMPASKNVTLADQQVNREGKYNPEPGHGVKGNLLINHPRVRKALDEASRQFQDAIKGKSDRDKSYQYNQAANRIIKKVSGK